MTSLVVRIARRCSGRAHKSLPANDTVVYFRVAGHIVERPNRCADRRNETSYTRRTFNGSNHNQNLNHNFNSATSGDCDGRFVDGSHVGRSCET